MIISASRCEVQHRAVYSQWEPLDRCNYGGAPVRTQPEAVRCHGEAICEVTAVGVDEPVRLRVCEVCFSMFVRNPDARLRVFRSTTINAEYKR